VVCFGIPFFFAGLRLCVKDVYFGRCTGRANFAASTVRLMTLRLAKASLTR
jgi:hypothetical protein